MGAHLQAGRSGILREDKPISSAINSTRCSISARRTARFVQQGRTYSMNRRSWSAGISSTYTHAASAALIS